MKKSIILGGFLVSSLAMAETSSSSLVSQFKELTQEFYVADAGTSLASSPSFSFGAASGFVPGYGTAFIGIGGSHNDGTTDGGLSVGGGFGDPVKSVGGVVSLGIGSIDPTDGGAFNRGSGSVSLGKTFPAYGLGASVGISNVDLWHADSIDEVDESYYVAVTKILPNDIAPVIVSVGLGSNTFADVNDDNSATSANENKDKWGEFISGAVYVHPQMSLVLDYTSAITTFGTSIVPMPKYPVTVGLAAQDIFKHDNVDEGVKFVGSLSISFTF